MSDRPPVCTGSVRNRPSWWLRGLAMALGLVGTALMAGSSVSYYEEALPSTLNPLFARTMVDRRSQELVFDRLYYRSAITNELKSRLVSRPAERLEDGRKLKLYLKEGIKWHDGKAFGPDDICFTIDAMLDPSTPSEIAKDFRESIVGCDKVNRDNAAVIEFVKPYHNPEERIAFSVLPEHIFDSTSISPDLDFSARPVGTGPMKGSRGSRVVKFTSFPNEHHNARIDELSMTEGGDPFVQVRTLLNAGVQGLISVAPPLRPDIAASDDVALKSYDLRSWWFMALNTSTPALADRRVRQAINHTLDRSALRELTVGVDPNDTNPPCEFVSGPFVQSSPYYNRSVKVLERSDRARSRQLMTEAGAKMQAGRWIMNGQPITLRIGMNAPLNAEARDLLNQIGNQLQEGGFDRQVYMVSSDDWVQKAVTGRLRSEYDVLIGKWSFGVVEDVNAMFHSRKRDGKGSQNIFNYSETPRSTAILAIATRPPGRTPRPRTPTTTCMPTSPTTFPMSSSGSSTRSRAWRNEVRNNTISPYFYFTEFDGWRL